MNIEEIRAKLEEADKKHGRYGDLPKGLTDLREEVRWLLIQVDIQSLKDKQHVFDPAAIGVKDFVASIDQPFNVQESEVLTMQSLGIDENPDLRDQF